MKKNDGFFADVCRLEIQLLDRNLMRTYLQTWTETPGGGGIKINFKEIKSN